MNDNEFDLAFCCDATGSMGSFMEAAKREMISLIETTADSAGVDVKFALVEYEDHDDIPVTKAHPFTGSVRTTKKYIEGLRPGGGGDWPEAVFDGIQTAVEKLKWREHARRIIILVGDAPPHGTAGSRDHPTKCKCGKTLAETTAMVEDNAITLHGICLTSDTHFGEIAHVTGGMTFDAHRHGDAMKELKNLLDLEFGNMTFDRKVLELHKQGKSRDEIGDDLNESPWQVGESLGRLGNRNLLGDVLEPA